MRHVEHACGIGLDVDGEATSIAVLGGLAASPPAVPGGAALPTGAVLGGRTMSFGWVFGSCARSSRGIVVRALAERPPHYRLLRSNGGCKRIGLDMKERQRMSTK